MASLLGSARVAIRMIDSDGTNPIPDASGNGHTAQYGSTAGVDTNDPLYLAPDGWTATNAGTQYGYLPGTNGNYFSTPDAAALDIVGDIDLRVWVAADDVSDATQGLICKESAFNTISYRFLLTSSALQLVLTGDGSTGVAAISSAAIPFGDGVAGWLRATWKQSDSECKFWTSTDGSSWTQLGTTRTLTLAAIYSSSSPVEIGTRRGGTSYFLAGKIYRAQIYDGIDGTLVFDADLTDRVAVTEPFATFTEASANAATVTIHRSAAGPKTSIVDIPLALHGTNKYFDIVDDATLNFAHGDSFTMVGVFRTYDKTPAADMALVVKKDDLTTSAGYGLYNDTGGTVRVLIADGTADDEDDCPAITEGELVNVAGVRDVGADTVEGFTEGIGSGSAVTDTTTATLSNAFPLRIGATSNVAASFLDGEFMGMGIWPSALTAAEIVQAGNELLGTWPPASPVELVAYRAHVFTTDGLDRNADGTVNLAGCTYLTPRAGAAHSDDFKVATLPDVSGFQPYLDMPRGRRGQIDPLTRTVDTGQMSLGLLDHRTGTGNLTRWVTAFIGDDEGRNQLLGLPVFVEESTDSGVTWTAYFCGIIHNVPLLDRLHIGFTLRDLADEMEAPVFVGRPHSSITYAGPASLLPNSLVESYAAFDTLPQIPADTAAWSETGVGSGIYLDIDHKEYAKRDKDGQALVITKSLADLAIPSFLPDSRTGLDVDTEDVRVRLTVVAGGATGEFNLESAHKGSFIMGPFGVWLKNVKHWEVRRVFIKEVPSTDPDFLAMPSADTAVTFDIISTAPPQDGWPLMIDDVHPVQLWVDQVDGKFGRINPDGTVAKSFPRENTIFPALIADESFGTFRGQIRDEDITNEWIEENICLPYGLSYYVDGDGRVVPMDWRQPASYGSLTTIGNDDLDTKGGSPGWEDSADNAIRELHLTHYVDQILDPAQSIKDDPGTFPATPPVSITETSRTIVPIPFGREEIQYKKPFVINALGFRYMGADTSPESLLGQARGTVIQNRLLGLARDLESAYGAGLRIAVLECRRTANTGSVPGDLRIVDVDELPDPATNLRGGPRVMRCVGRAEDGIRVRLRFLDLGQDAVAVGPTLGTLALTVDKNKSSVTQPVTLNGDSERVRLDIALTPTSTGTRPAEASELWRNAAYVDATGDVVIPGLPAGTRIWPRARTDPDATQVNKLPSGWVYPTSPAYVDTTALTPPSSGASDVQDGSETELSWTVGEDDADVVVALDGDEVARLIPGSDFYLMRGTVASTGYAATVWHDDRRGGVSTALTINFTSGGTPATCPAPGGIDLLIGDRV